MKRHENCTFPQKLYTRKLGEITVFYTLNRTAKEVKIYKEILRYVYYFTKAWKDLTEAVTELWNKFQVLEEVGIAQKVKRVCGASVGAITASLVAVGYTSEDLKEFMETDLRKVLVGKIRSHLADILILYYIKERWILRHCTKNEVFH